MDNWLRRSEAAVLTLLLGALIALGITQVVMRNFFDSGFPWIDPVARASVLWLGLLGAIAAARQSRHIRIDLVQRFAPPRLAGVLEAALDMVAALVCGLIAWHAARMVIDERSFETMAFAQVPVWWLQIIIPFAFGAMALAYLATCVLGLGRSWRA